MLWIMLRIECVGFIPTVHQSWSRGALVSWRDELLWCRILALRGCPGSSYCTAPGTTDPSGTRVLSPPLLLHECAGGAASEPINQPYTLEWPLLNWEFRKQIWFFVCFGIGMFKLNSFERQEPTESFLLHPAICSLQGFGRAPLSLWKAQPVSANSHSLEKNNRHNIYYI